MIFTNARPGEPDAAFVEVNEPKDSQEIPELVKRGYIVRTRTDADMRQAVANDTSTRDAALASGAQMLSTDFPFTEKFANGYAVVFPQGGISRCNPVNASSTCDSGALEPSRPGGGGGAQGNR